MSSKLSLAQTEFLRIAGKYGEANANPGNRTTACLSKLGLIEASYKGVSNESWKITDAGREALADL